MDDRDPPGGGGLVSRLRSLEVHGTGAAVPMGLKGQVFRLALSGCDLLVGPNGAGKTTRGPLAITAAIEGLASVPTDPRRPYVGALPDGTSVTLEVDTPNGVQTLTRDLSLVRGGAVERSNQRARDIVGIPPTAWDLRDFAAGTDGARGKILDAVARAGGALQMWDAPHAQERVADGLKRLIEAGCDLQSGAWMAPYNACVCALPIAPDGATWLQSALVWAEGEQTRRNTVQREASGHLTGVLGEVPPPPEGTLDAAEATHRELLVEQVRIADDAARAEQARAAVLRHEAEGERLRASLADQGVEGKRLAVAGPRPGQGIPEAVSERLRAAAVAMEAPIPPIAGADLNVLIQALGRTEQTLADEEKLLVERRELLRAAEEATAAEQAEATRLDRALAAARAAVLALGSVSGQGHATCRECGCDDPLGIIAAREEADTQATALGEQYDAARRAVDTARVPDARTACERAQSRHEGARSAFVRAGISLDAARAAPAQHEAEVRAARERESASAHAEAIRERQRCLAAVAAWESAESRREEQLTAARQRYRASAAALATWESAEPPSVPEPLEEHEQDGLARRVHMAQEIVAQHRAYDAAVERVRFATASYEDARLAWDATRAFVAAIRQARDDMAAAAYMPIEIAARELISDGDGLPIPYFTGPSDYGAVVPGQGRVPYAGLSESEQRITASAFVYALAVASGCPVRLVLLDGLEVVQRDHRGALLGALVRAVEEGRVDNVVATMAIAPGEVSVEVPGLTVHLIEQTAPSSLPMMVAADHEEKADVPF